MPALQRSVKMNISMSMSHTVKRVPKEHLACQQPTANFINPLVVKVHPGWLVGAEMAGLHIGPEVTRTTLPEPAFG
jgi:hypothetical protein